MSRIRHLAEIKQLEQALTNAIYQMESEYPDEPYKPVFADLKQLEKDTVLLGDQKVKQVAIVIINNQKYILMGNQVIQLPQASQPVVAYPLLDALLDAVSLQPIPGAAATLVSRMVDNPAVAVIDSNGNLLPQGAGVVNVTSTNTWSYTDEDTQQPVTGKSETTTTPYSITSGPEQVLQQETLGAPVAAGTVPAVTPPVTPATT